MLVRMIPIVGYVMMVVMYYVVIDVLEYSMYSVQVYYYIMMMMSCIMLCVRFTYRTRR